MIKQRNAQPFEITDTGDVGQKCSCGSGKFITWDGAHVGICDQGKVARARLHTNVNTTMHMAMKDTGLESRLEPRTTELLNNRIPPEILGRMFNDRGMRSKEVQKLVQDISEPDTGKQEAKDGVSRACSMVRNAVLDGKGLRLDGRVTLSRKMVATWDATVVHTLSALYRRRAKDFCLQEAR